MTQAPRHPCSQPGCSTLVAVGMHRCELHARKPWGKHAGARYPQGWKALRAQVLREEPYCELCGAPSTCVDHRIPRFEGGGEERQNLRGLCDACHAIVTAQQGTRARQRAHQPISGTRLFSGSPRV